MILYNCDRERKGSQVRKEVAVMTAKKKHLKLRSEVKELLGVLLFYSVIVLGVIVLNARMEYLNNIQSSEYKEVR